MKLLDLGEDLWVPYLIGALPSDVTFLIAREPVEKFRDYSHIRGMLLQRGPRRHVKASEDVNDGRQVSFRKPERPHKKEYPIRYQMRDPLSDAMAVGNKE
ncbi:hypothetical protein TNCV_1784491 [Trichonephila clavipes]|nr:hypothetical protein TNCV_1784491 [Trichonephila clavipes]